VIEMLFNFSSKSFHCVKIVWVLLSGMIIRMAHTHPLTELKDPSCRDIELNLFRALRWIGSFLA